MKHLYITDDTNLTIPTVRMRCDCGWEKKGFKQRITYQMAETHMKNVHTEGLIHVEGTVQHIKR